MAKEKLTKLQKAETKVLRIIDEHQETLNSKVVSQVIIGVAQDYGVDPEVLYMKVRDLISF